MKSPILYLLVGLLLLSGCTRPEKAKAALAAAGYTDITITGWRPFTKSKDEWYSTGFKAKGQNGAVVTGAVTEGLLFKGATIRTD